MLSERLKAFGIQINRKKSKFGVTDFVYCGYRVIDGKTTVDPAKLSLVTDWPTPCNVTDVRRFLGFVGYYRRFIRNYAGIAAPLTDLTKSNRPWSWTLCEQRAFNDLKKALLSEPVLAAPDDEKPYDVKVDAGPFAIGGVLEQDGHPVAYEYHRLSEAESKYSQYEREFLAALICLRKWKHYIEGRTVRLHTDNSGLVQLLKQQKDPHHRIARWLDEFSLYSPDIIHVAGKVNVADAPSRVDIPYLSSNVPLSDLDCERGLEVAAVWISDVLHIDIDDVDDWPLLCAHFILAKRHPEGLSEELKTKIEKESEKFTIIDDKLIRILANKTKVHYVPKDSRIETMERFHQGLGHLKYGSIKELITRRFWWPSMEKDMIDFIRNCPQCQLAASSNVVHARPPVQPLPPVAIPFERWALDFVGPLTVTAQGNRYILTAIDYATRWVVCKAVPEADAETVKKFLYDLMVDYGSPSEVLTDRGKAFLAKGVQDFMSANRIMKLTTAPYHPQTNGMVERMHAMLKSGLTALTNGNPVLWDLFLKQVLFSIRVRKHAVTKYSPFYLMYGVQPTLPGDLRNPELPPVPLSDADVLVRNTQAIIELGYARGSAYQESLLQAARMRQSSPPDQRDYFFQIGDWVKRKNGNPSKFEFNWTGPYMIAEVGHPGTYWLRKMNGEMLTAPINQMDLAPWLANTRDNVSFFYEPVLPEAVSDEDV
jgi:transposase InsO family protein